MRLRKGLIGKLLLASGLMLGLNMATCKTSLAAYENDVTPPWGRISIVGATEINNVNYVDRTKLTVQIYAADDMCEPTEIKYYISTTEPSATERIDSGWNDYETGETAEVEISTSSINVIYAVFKDANGNTSRIYTGGNATYTVQYNVNYENAPADAMPTGMATTGYFGAPFIVTNQTPTREGYYFLGWNTYASANEASYCQGEIIPANVFTGATTTIPLYAIWTTNYGDLPELADVVSVGDYVNYPVYYDNVATYETSHIAARKGWRVLSKDVSNGTVNLVSAGVPLTYYHYTDPAESVSLLNDSFLDIPFDASAYYTFRKTGFNPYEKLETIFTNKYTATNSSNKPLVRAMTKDDLDDIYDPTGATVTASRTYVKDAKYQDLLAIPCSDMTSYWAYYWLASAYPSNTNDLWCVHGVIGSVSCNGSNESGVRPVVSLKSGVKAVGTDMIGAWNIEI